MHSLRLLLAALVTLSTSLALAQECTAPTRRPSAGFDAAAQQDEILAAQLDGVVNECARPGAPCDEARKRCREYDAMVTRSAGDHDEGPYLADIQGGWLGQPYTVMPLPEEGNHGTAACDALTAQAQEDAVARRKSANRHRRLVAEWEHWFRFASSTVERCKAGTLPKVVSTFTSNANLQDAPGKTLVIQDAAPSSTTVTTSPTTPPGLTAAASVSATAETPTSANGAAPAFVPPASDVAVAGAASAAASPPGLSSTGGAADTVTVITSTPPVESGATSATDDAWVSPTVATGAAGVAAGVIAGKGNGTEAERRAAAEKERVAKLWEQRKADEARKQAALEAQRQREEARRAADAVERQKREAVEAAEKRRREAAEAVEKKRQAEVAELARRQEAAQAKAVAAQASAEEAREEAAKKLERERRAAAEKKMREEREAKERAAKKEQERLEKQEELRRAEFEKKRREREAAEERRKELAASRLEKAREAEEEKLEKLEDTLDEDGTKSGAEKEKILARAKLDSGARLKKLERDLEEEHARAEAALSKSFEEEDALEHKRRDQAEALIDDAGRIDDPRARTHPFAFIGGVVGMSSISDSALNVGGAAFGGSFSLWMDPPLEGLSSGFELLARAHYEQSLGGVPYRNLHAMPHARAWIGRVGVGAVGEFRQQSGTLAVDTLYRESQELSVGPAVSFAFFDSREGRLIASARWLPLLDGAPDALAAELEASYSFFFLHAEVGTVRGRNAAINDLQGLRAAGTVGLRYRFD